VSNHNGQEYIIFKGFMAGDWYNFFN